MSSYVDLSYRLLVLYTPSAASYIGAANVKNWVNAWMINKVSEICSASADPGNSPIYRVQLAAIDSVNYTEVTMSTDLDSLTHKRGVFSRISELRQRYSADVVILVAKKNGYSGISGIWQTIVGPDKLFLRPGMVIRYSLQLQMLIISLIGIPHTKLRSRWQYNILYVCQKTSKRPINLSSQL